MYTFKRAPAIPEKVLKPNCYYIANKTKSPIPYIAYFYSVDIINIHE